MLLGRFLEGKKEHSGGKTLRCRMDQGVVAKDQLGREIGKTRRTGNQCSLILDRGGRGKSREIGRLDVRKAPWLVATGRERQGLEKIPGLLLLLMKPTGPVTGDRSERGDRGR